MDDQMLERIRSNPDYRRLRDERLRFGWTLTIIMMIIYYGFILMIAFGKGFLGSSVSGGSTTWGIPLGFGVIVATVVLTAIYVRRANSAFDAMSDRIRREALK